MKAEGLMQMQTHALTPIQAKVQTKFQALTQTQVKAVSKAWELALAVVALKALELAKQELEQN